MGCGRAIALFTKPIPSKEARTTAKKWGLLCKEGITTAKNWGGGPCELKNCSFSLFFVPAAPRQKRKNGKNEENGIWPYRVAKTSTPCSTPLYSKFEKIGLRGVLAGGVAGASFL